MNERDQDDLEPRMLLASDVMTTDVVTVRPDTSIHEIARVFTERHISGAPVVDEDGQVIGIVTEGDLLLKAAGPPGGIPRLAFFLLPPRAHNIEEHLRRAEGRTAADVMVRKVITCGERTPVRELAALMARHEIARIPIVREGTLVGIVSRSDVLRLFARGDDAVAADVREVLARRVGATGLEVESRDGVVFVRGTVELRSDARTAQVSTLSVDGVVGVDVSQIRWRRDDLPV